MFIKLHSWKIPSHLWIAATGWLSRILIGLVQLVSIPVFYQKLGLHDFAVFTVITGLVAWYSLLDLGIGTALQNFISEYRVQEKKSAALITAVIPLLVLLIFGIAILIALLGGTLKTWLFSHLPNNLTVENFDIILFLYCTNFVFLIGNKVLFAYHKGFWGYAYQLMGYIILLILMCIIHFFHVSLDLSKALYYWIIPLFLSSMVMMVHAFKISDAKLQNFNWNTVFYKQLMLRAMKFWLVAFSANGVLAIDYLVIVKLLSAQDIIAYNIVNKIFMMMLFIYAAVLSALWPVLAEHYARRTVQNYMIAERELKRSIIGGIIYMLFATLCLVLLRNFITEIFRVHQAIALSIMLLLSFGFYGCLRVFIDTYTTALQARNQMRLFIWLTPLQAIVAIPAMIYLAKFGLIGVMSALILSFVVLPLWIIPSAHYRNLGFLKHV